MPAQPFFLPTPQGPRFCLYHPAQARTPHALVLHAHAFAEEMNCARRMVALQSQALAQAGYAVLLLDLGGCGDSAGDFGDARWDGWVADVAHASQWLQAQAPRGTPLWLWGLRAGCLLALQAAQQIEEVAHLLFWQPPSAGAVLLRQFLRLRLAADLLGGAVRGATQQWLQQLHQGQTIEVAGYRLAPAVALGLERAGLAAPHPGQPVRRVEWFQLAQDSAPPLAVPPDWQQPGIALVRHSLPGPAFWQIPGAAAWPALLAATTRALAARPA